LLDGEQKRAGDEAVAVLAARIKPSLSGMQAGSVLVGKALADEDLGKAKKGWAVLSKGYSQLQALLQDMMCFAEDTGGDKEACDVKKLVQGVADALREKASSKGIKISVTNGTSGPDMLPVDGTVLRHALRSLLEWAVDQKSGSGQATIEVRVIPGEAGEPLTLVVTENCSRTAASEISQLFNLTDSERSVTTTSLGLALVHKIVQSNGGSIDVEVGEDKKTVFTIKLSK
jgi:signal transduction histidine kinase